MRRKQEQHQNWQGDVAGYEAKHKFIRTHLGKATCCTVDPAHVNRLRYEWVNLNHKYSRNLGDYIQACMQCHRKYDRGLLKIKGQTLMERGGKPLYYIGNKCLSPAPTRNLKA